MGRIGTTVVGVPGVILILLVFSSGCSRLDQVRGLEKLVRDNQDTIRREVPVQYFSEKDYLSFFENDGKWPVREFTDCRFAAPPGDIGTQPTAKEYIRGGDQYTLIVGRNVPFVKSYVRVLVFHDELREHMDDHFFFWKAFFMGKEAYGDYRTSVTRASWGIGEADKIEIVQMEDGSFLMTNYKDNGSSYDKSSINVGPWKQRYIGHIYCYNKTLGVQDLIIYRCEDPLERDQAIRRIVATYSCRKASGEVSVPPGG